MGLEVMDSIVLLVENLILQNKLANFHIDWFGGEPLICYKTIMKPLCAKLKSILLKYGVTFTMSMTTNGYLIRSDMIPFFEEYNFISLQITLDGDENDHNKVRFHRINKEGSFGAIINNICTLLHSPKVSIILRINYTKDVLLDSINIINKIPKELRHKINITLAQVWQEKKYSDDVIRNNLLQIESDVYEAFFEAGFNVKKTRISCGKYYSCYADLHNQAIINYDGRVFNCTAVDFEKKKEAGILTKDGNIIWDENIKSERLSKATFDHKMCLSCTFLPICTGSCYKNPIDVLMSHKCSFIPKRKESIQEVLEFFSKKDYKIAQLSQIIQMLSYKS